MPSRPRSKTAPADIGFLVESLDQGFQPKTLDGPNLGPSIRGVSVGEAAWSPERDLTGLLLRAVIEVALVGDFAVF